MRKSELLNRLNENIKALYDYSLVPGRFSKDEKIPLICKKCNKTFLRIASSQLRGATCPYCGLRKRHTTESFIKYAKQIYGTRYSYTKTVYKASREKVTITCNRCGKDFETTVNNFLRGRGCPHCRAERLSEKFRQPKEEFIKKAREIHGDKYDYSKVIYRNNRTPVTIVCKKHNAFFNQTPTRHLLGSGCPLCKPISKGEEEIKKLLIKKNVAFEQQKTFEKCKDKLLLPFDFYLPKYNLCVEYQGKQHYETVEFFGGEKEFEIRQKHDKIKRNFCKKNKIVLLEIKYSDNIESKLNEFFINHKK